MEKDDVVAGVSEWITWWLEQRKNKLRSHLSDTMSVNPFLMPILFDLHNFSDLTELTEFVVASHLMVGHNTGFGKLIDEKILPQVFGSEKLNKKFRSDTAPYAEPIFNEVDHVINRADGTRDLLSLKAGKWTIQLTMAMQLNHSFNAIIEKHGAAFNEIAVGVFYGDRASLTDKYDILRGINRGAHHDVIDLTERVSVYAGREFWAWLNEGENKTQDWVIEGISSGLKSSDIRTESDELLKKFNAKVSADYDRYLLNDGNIDWKALLTSING